MGSLRIIVAAFIASFMILIGCEKGQTPMPGSADTPGPAPQALGPALCATFRVELWLEYQELDRSDTVVKRETVKKFVADLSVPPGSNVSASQKFLDGWCVALSFSDLAVTPEGAQCGAWEWSADVAYGDDTFPTQFSTRGHISNKYSGSPGKPHVFPLGKEIDGPVPAQSHESDSPTEKRRYLLWRNITLVAIGPRKT